MRFIKKHYTVAFCLVYSLLCVQPLLAQDVPTNVWVEVVLEQVQVGVHNSSQDTRLLCTAVDNSFTSTWLVVDRTAANIVAGGALTAYALGHNAVIYIAPYGTDGYRVPKLRIVAP